MPHPSVEYAPPAPFLAALDELAEVYRAAFAGPPWDESADQVRTFVAAVPGWVGRDGFTAAWAHDESGIAGFAFRVRTPAPVPADGFYGLLGDRFGSDVVAELAGSAEVVELAVRPDAWGRGLGRALLTAIVGDHPAWLVTRTAATATMAFYARLGWQVRTEDDGLALLTR
ncbi:MAG: GNAT family N-acetyltransferase [Hamadaea sp.]|uniref:GNAT family N-acetyltransferase n=1 Tax=Hamadaea sp. TaxID=2024425 RepID=UPI0018557AF8|nr:GNAT family N-acetyltransferase [Hamadaea sp.]NUR72459.1 GNAT family N-acetyltransferase [Hamadaea sp.]NUT22225.1 GNAT family N-acetyltransferase [Hamadaea sp.]